MIDMSTAIKNLERRLIRWNLIYRLLVLVLLTNGTIVLLYCFTKYTSALQWVYGGSIWGAIAVQVGLTLVLSVAYHKARHYYAVIQGLQNGTDLQDELNRL